MIRSLFVLAVLALGACTSSLNVRRYSSSTALYTAGLARFQEEQWSNAITAFEKLTFDLPTRDTLLSRSHWYLGHARRNNNERLLAAQSFIRLAELFPDDSLADDAIYWSAKSYRELWRKPQLDPQYGILAQAQFRLLQGVFPDSPFADSTRRELAELDEWFATKDFESGLFYVRRRAYDSAIIYFQDVVTNWPNTDRARQSMLELVKIYRLPQINYQEDAAEVCAALRAGFPTDPEVLQACKLPVPDGGVPTAGR